MDFMEFEPLESKEEAEATEYCYDAMESDDYHKKIHLANIALKIYPTSVEAWDTVVYMARQ